MFHDAFRGIEKKNNDNKKIKSSLKPFAWFLVFIIFWYFHSILFSFQLINENVSASVLVIVIIYLISLFLPYLLRSK
jgi:uncharacterized membrane-anchored protein